MRWPLFTAFPQFLWKAKKEAIKRVKERFSSSADGPDPGTILQPINELEPGPNVIDGANLYIDQARCQTDCAHICLRQISNHAGTLLWPRDPKHSGRG